jgi:hypothetical protein
MNFSKYPAIDHTRTLDLFIKNFISKERRERSDFELKDVKKRSRFTSRLNHRWDIVLDMRFITQIPRVPDQHQYIIRELNIRDTELCYVISNYDDVDGQVFEFSHAFQKVYARGFASIITNLSADKMYLETEQEFGPPERFIGFSGRDTH